jgi:energy-coupling factor transporter ATP-binding protein EcfA2
MQLSEFKVKNFRSIINSGWNKLSSDNITALIGQNESGKTSVLEALYSFFKGDISEDVLRSDLSTPEVSCSFLIKKDELEGMPQVDRLPREVHNHIGKFGKVTLTRSWYHDMTSQIILSGENVSTVFDQIETIDNNLRKEVIDSIDKFFTGYKECENEIKILTGNIDNFKSGIEKLRKKQTEISRQAKRPADPEQLEIYRKNADSVLSEIDQMSEELVQEEKRLYDHKAKLSSRELIYGYAEKCMEFMEESEHAKSESEDAWKNLFNIEKSLAFLTGEKERRAGEMKLFETKEKFISGSRRYQTLKEHTGISIRIVKNLLAGKEAKESEQNAKTDFSLFNNLFTRTEAGEAFFNIVPCYEFFEDFSSLLPNRIDMEDILEGNKNVEGYKAVRNFLMIAGLETDFFKQNNNRILKQKIENLNNEVTIDFQDYWRQNVGKTNKIRLHFELEHYDISHPEKKGKPYLEFWIKDEFERLYPKQRSRGVRWFLSFYLELKAYARENKNNPRVLLIDEPGLSLHACAQEDVLKVFEDIKDNIQIIYTTHSPHLIDHNKLYRIIAIQRANETSEHSETLFFDSTRLQSATSDTLSPISSIMGASLGRQQLLLQKDKNIIVEDICSYYYLSSLYKLLKKSGTSNFLPATGPAGVSTLVNLLTGWGFNYYVFLFGSEKNFECIEQLKLQLIAYQEDSKPKFRFSEKFPGPEDVFSTLDFKKHIIKKRIGIAGSNSEYIMTNEISRPLLSSAFAQEVTSGNITIDDLDEETQENIKEIFDNLPFMTGDET